jgi:hypothetical protein
LEKGNLAVSFLFSRRNIHDYKYPSRYTYEFSVSILCRCKSASSNCKVAPTFEEALLICTSTALRTENLDGIVNKGCTLQWALSHLIKYLSTDRRAQCTSKPEISGLESTRQFLPLPPNKKVIM